MSFLSYKPKKPYTCWNHWFDPGIAWVFTVNATELNFKNYNFKINDTVFTGFTKEFEQLFNEEKLLARLKLV